MQKIPIDSLRNILGRIAEKQVKGASRVLIAIDGAGGAGKSTVAKCIQEELTNVSIVSIDDFYRPVDPDLRRGWNSQEGYQMFFDWIRLRDQALMPIHEGIAPKFQSFDWTRNQLTDWKHVPLNPVVIVEGVYVLRPELRPFYNLSVFIEAPKDICTSRLRARGDSEQDIHMWQAAEDWYMANIRPQDTCDIICS